MMFRYLLEENEINIQQYGLTEVDKVFIEVIT